MHSRNWKPQTGLSDREGAPHQQIRNCLEILKERRRKIGRGSQIGAWHQDRLTVGANITLTLSLSKDHLPRIIPIERWAITSIAIHYHTYFRLMKLYSYSVLVIRIWGLKVKSCYMFRIYWPSSHECFLVKLSLISWVSLRRTPNSVLPVWCSYFV
jgi:hypothetical protein